MNAPLPSKRNKILAAAKEKGMLRPRDLASLGVDGTYLYRMAERGDLVRSARGLYHLPEADITEHHGLAEAAKRMPRAVICLLSAARFHDLGSETPSRIWLALPRGSERPRPGGLQFHLAWFAPEALGPDMGIETHTLEGVPVRITSLARTLVDLFRARNKVGMEIVLEAFRDGIRRHVSLEEIHRYARVLRAENTLRPYLEALV